MEACGVVTAVGPGVTDRQVGDLVAYGGTPMGCYAEEQIFPTDKVVPVPDFISPVIAASILVKGMTTQFLLRRCFKVHLVMHPHFSIILSWLGKLGKSKENYECQSTGHCEKINNVDYYCYLIFLNCIYTG